MKKWIAVLLLLLLAACSSSTSNPKQSANPPAGNTAGSSAGSPASSKPATNSGSAPDCPLDAAQVAKVLGQAMVADHTAGACAFRPASGKLLPSAIYNKQYAFLM